MLFKIILLLFPLYCCAVPFGKDADLVDFRFEEECACTSPCTTPGASGPGVKISQVLIGFHQRVITQIDGPRSHFRPSSSQYTLDAIEKYGFFKGFILGCDRLLRENEEPWIYPERLNEHGELYKWDPVP